MNIRPQDLTSFIRIVIETSNDGSNMTPFPWHKDVLEYVSSHNLKRLGSGGQRTVYALPDGAVLKVATGADGKRQNVREASLMGKKYDRILTRVYSSAPDGSWVVAERVEPIISDKQLNNAAGLITPATWESVTSYLEDALIFYGPKRKPPMSRNEIINDVTKRFRIESHPFWSQYLGFIKDESINAWETLSVNQWGITHDGRVVLMDFGG